jgi:hypothetical protein
MEKSAQCEALWFVLCTKNHYDVNSRRMSSPGHVAYMVKMKNAFIIMVGDVKGRDHLDSLGGPL